MKIPRICVVLLPTAMLCSVVHAAQTTNATQSEGAAVVMAPYHVSPYRGWSQSFKYDRKKRIREIVFHVERGSPAANAGLKTGDRLIAYGGRSVIGMTSAEYVALDKVVRSRREGDPLILPYTITRDGKTRDVIVTIPAISEEKRLNKAPEPTPTSITYPAQEPRQP